MLLFVAKAEIATHKKQYFPLPYSQLLLDEADGADGYDANRSVDLGAVPLVVHIYQLVTGDESLPVHEMIEVGSETINGGTVWLLPSMEMHGLWESLIFDSNIKLNLLNYAQSALLFADCRVSITGAMDLLSSCALLILGIDCLAVLAASGIMHSLISIFFSSSKMI